MNNPMQQMMQKMMAGMMKPDDMPDLMHDMMDGMFKQMPAEERIHVMQSLLPRCMNSIFAELEPEARTSLADKMLASMADVVRANSTGAKASHE